MKKNSLLCFQVLKIHPVYIIILQDEGYKKCDHKIIFGSNVRTVHVHFIKVHGDNRVMARGLFKLSTRHR